MFLSLPHFVRIILFVAMVNEAKPDIYLVHVGDALDFNFFCGYLHLSCLAYDHILALYFDSAVHEALWKVRWIAFCNSTTVITV